MSAPITRIVTGADVYYICLASGTLAAESNCSGSSHTDKPEARHCDGDVAA
ncbi:Uncharacterised protein [Mycobacteroides abscessus subsp. abscessus]|nr:Uncharacterised protein [Mycobacteroides abscessus subsp. abscessus]